MVELIPEVPVVFPTHDRERMLCEHALPCALGQPGVQIKVVVGCDGSPDGFARRADGIRDPRVTSIGHPTARGVANARNAGIAAATSEWVECALKDAQAIPLTVR